MNGLTYRQEEVLSFIKDFVSENHYPPTYRDIGKRFNITMKGAFDHVKALERKGVISHTTGIARSIFIN
jgi:repressor LexA